MFNSLEQMQSSGESKKEASLKWVLVAVVSAVLFVGLYMALRLAE